MTLDNRGRTGDSPESTGGTAKIAPAANVINAATLGTPSATLAATPTGHNTSTGAITSPASSTSPASPPFASGSTTTTANTSTPSSTNVSGSSGSGGDAHNKSSSFADLSNSSPPPPPPSCASNIGAAISQQSADELIDGFPEAKLRSLTTKISNSRWVVPVLPTQELECLLNYAIRLTQAGCDHDCEPCMRFYRESLYISFVKILTDEAVTTWKFNIQYCILNTCGKLLQLCALHMSRDNAHLLDLLAIVLDPDNKFNTFNVSRTADQYVMGGPGSGSPNNSSGTTASGSGSPGSPVLGAGPWGLLDESSTYARSPAEPSSPRGWLVDLLNRFGQFGGFDNLLERFNAGIALLNRAATDAANAAAAAEDHGDFRRKISSATSPPSGTESSTSATGAPVTTTKITLQLIHSLLRPFGQCFELLTVPTIERYFMPIWEVVLNLMDGLSDEDLKREAKPEGRSDSINGIVKSARALASRLENQEHLIRELEMFRLKMVLRLLKVSGFTGKMNALNEINKMLSVVKYPAQRTQLGGGGGGNGGGGGGQGQSGGGGGPTSGGGTSLGSDDDMDWLTPERMATWIKESDVLGIVLRDSLHQAQYVEKLEHIIRFLIKEKVLTLADLDAVWRAQDGKHETIVKNVHELLAKLAWYFDAEQLDHLFDCFEASMSTANKRQRDRLLELIRRLAEDDKIGVMAHKVLCRFWQLAHSPEIAQDVLDQALGAHVKILDYSCTKDKDAQKALWLDRCVHEVKSPTNESWVLPALRLIREICCLYETTPSHMPRTQTLNRQHVIERLQNEHSLVILVTNSLTAYMERLRANIALRAADPHAVAAINGSQALCDGHRYTHAQQIQERLDFLKFVLKDGQLWLCADQARQIWSCLAVQAVFGSDRDECFRWFGKLMGDEPDLDPGINRQFFETNFLQLEPHMLSEAGIKCFERFFKAVNAKVDKLKAKSRFYVLDDEDLIGKDYLWRVITTGNEEIAHKAIELLIEVSTALGPRLQSTIVDYHEHFISECCDRLRAYYDTMVLLTSSIEDALLQGERIQETGADAKPLFQAVLVYRKQRQFEAEKMCRVLRVLQEYIKECDRAFNGERISLPLSRAHRGKQVTLFIRFQHAGRPIEDVEIVSHVNEMMATLKRNLLRKIKGSQAAASQLNNIKVDFCYGSGELIEIADDRLPISQYMFRDKTVLTAKLTPIGPGGSGGLANSPDSSSDSSTGSPPRPCPDVQRTDSERTLPGVIITHKVVYAEFFLRIYQMGADLSLPALRDSCAELLHLLPLDRQTIIRLHAMCFSAALAPVVGEADVRQSANGSGGGQEHNAANSSCESSSSTSSSPAPGSPAITATATTADTVDAKPADAAEDGKPTSAAGAPPPLPPPPKHKVIMPTPEQMFLHSTPATVLYNLEVLHALLKPAIDPFNINNLKFQSAWVHSGCAHFILGLLTKNNFLPLADTHTKRAAFQCVLRLTKIFLYIVGCVLGKVGDEPESTTATGEFGAAEGSRSQIEILKSTLMTIFGNAEQTVRAVSAKLADNVATEMLSDQPEGAVCRQLFASALRWSCPDLQTVKAIVQLCWASAAGRLHELGGDAAVNFGDRREANTAGPEPHDQSVCKDALEVLTISLVLNPAANETLTAEPMWSAFVTSIVLCNPVRAIRQQAAEQLYFACTYCAADWRPFGATVGCLVDALHTLVPQHAATSAEFFNLLCRSLSYGCKFQWPLLQNDALLEQEIGWLRSVKDVVRERGETHVHEDLLEGHLCLTKELMAFLPVALKSQLSEFVVELVDDFLYPASRQYLHLRRRGELVEATAPPPVCRSPHTVAAASDLVVALCQGSIGNMNLIVNTLLDMFFFDTEPLREWEYLSPVGPRPYRGFAGLKNAGATCYMNSVLQQLFMVPMIRRGILEAAGAATDPTEDFSGESDSMMTEVFDESAAGANRNQYHVGILKHVQAIFAHLGHSALQFYVPRGLWTHFKLQGEPVNLREQQDAVEFFMSLFESLDEGLKALGQPQLMGATLGGCFSDQKICKECPHRYAKEEPFSVFSVDIRNHSSLTESLEQYVKGELLEGTDAYYCDKCDKKVVTVKRLCVQRLPKVLAIQLKRFEYDYERVCAIKFNDYFEFPRVLNMEPYTVTGLAKLDNKMIDPNDDLPSTATNNDDDDPAIVIAAAAAAAAAATDAATATESTTYHLTGIVVHSGQASGGHYFSYILHRNPTTGCAEQWYKFDDGEVVECKMHDDDEMKAQCFGGDYMGEVYDNNLKRMQLRRQKRWWNAYMLFYTRSDALTDGCTAAAHTEQLSLAESRQMCLQMPAPIERSVRAQNLRFLHSRNLFAAEFFNFVRKLVEFRGPSGAELAAEKLSPQSEELSLLAVQLASQLLFHSGFRTKKALRGPAIDWFDTLSQHIHHSADVRRWFAANVLLKPPTRLAEYILVAPSQEVRHVFIKLVAICCIFAGSDPSLDNLSDNLAEQILLAVLQLLRTDVADHGKHLPHYFQLFNMYASAGPAQRTQLLKLNVPAIFIKVAIDEGPGPPIKYQNAELGKLHTVVAMLVRCSDVTARCQSSNERAPHGVVLPNVYADPHFISAAAAAAISAGDVPPTAATLPAAAAVLAAPLSKEASEYLYGRVSYTKKLLEDASAGEECLRLLQFCCWENPIFSRSVLTELLWLCSLTGHHLQDMRHHTELLLHVLLMEDSWQHHRIHNALNGVADEREGLLTIIDRVKKNYPRRAYQIVKLLVQLFKQSRVAVAMLNSNQEVAKHWTLAVEWLQLSLDRQRGGVGSGGGGGGSGGGQYAYSSWSPPGGGGQIYENANSGGGGSSSSYMLERTPSTKNTLRLACELCPDEEPDEPTDSDVEPLDADAEAIARTAAAAVVAPVPSASASVAPSDLKVLHQNSAGESESLDQQRQSHSHSRSASATADLDSIRDLEITSRSTDTSSNSSHATVVLQQQQQRMHNNGEEGQQQQQTPTSSLALGVGEPTEPATTQPFVTSVSQYGIIQPNEALMSCISDEQLTTTTNNSPSQPNSVSPTASPSTAAKFAPTTSPTATPVTSSINHINPTAATKATAPSQT